jgi:rubrerythrin
MGTKKLLKKLGKYLDNADMDEREHCDQLDELLDKIRKKEEKLKSKLEGESDPEERKHLKTELKIVALQLKRGTARREELGEKCGS